MRTTGKLTLLISLLALWLFGTPLWSQGQVSTDCIDFEDCGEDFGDTAFVDLCDYPNTHGVTFTLLDAANSIPIIAKVGLPNHLFRGYRTNYPDCRITDTTDIDMPHPDYHGAPPLAGCFLLTDYWEVNTIAVGLRVDYSGLVMQSSGEIWDIDGGLDGESWIITAWYESPDLGWVTVGVPMIIGPFSTLYWNAKPYAFIMAPGKAFNRLEITPGPITPGHHWGLAFDNFCANYNPDSTSAICGMKFADSNCNGELDLGELPLPNFKIWARTPPGTGTPFYTITGGNGLYCFDNLGPGTYEVWEDENSGWSQSYPPGDLYYVLLLPGMIATDIDFGNCPVDIMIRDCLADDGSVPSSITCQGWNFVSPDIRITLDPFDPTNTMSCACFGLSNYVWATVHNFGTAPAENIHVKYYFANFGIGLHKKYIGEADIPLLPGGTSTWPPIRADKPWTPVWGGSTDDGHRCLFVTLDCQSDPLMSTDHNWENNKGLRNLGAVWFDPPRLDYTAEIHFGVGNPDSAIANDVFLSLSSEVPEPWEILLTSPDGLVQLSTNEYAFYGMSPLQENDVTLTATAPVGTQSDTGEVYITGAIDDSIIGGIAVQILPPRPSIQIEKAHDVYQGHYEYVSITTENNLLEMGGFDFLIAYDASALTFMEAAPGQFLEDCGWEYFTYRYGWQGNCEGPCPSGLLRIVAIADLNNGPNHPSCFGPPDTHPHELAEMKFYVTNDRTYECMYVPIRFFWDDCGDNAISSVSGDTLFISDRVYDFEGTEVTGDVHYGGHRWLGDCDNPDPDKPDAIPFIDFVHGGIDIICSDSIDAPGDINLNEIANEIADAVLFTSYFIYGLSVFDINPQGQIAATDVNNDGRVLTVGDLVYMIRIITGDELAFPKLSPYAQSASVSMLVNHSAVAISSNSEADIGAGHFVFEHSGYEIGEPHLINGASEMTLKYHDEDGVLKVLVYSTEKDLKIASGAENIFVIPISGSGTIELTETELSDYYGNLLTVTKGEQPILPKAFALHQNYPNPFNATTRIIYELPKTSHVKIEVFNVIGQCVTTLIDLDESSGVHTVEWKANDQSGDRVASGVYLYRLTTDDFTTEKKMILLK